MKKLLFCAMTVALVASVVAAETKKPLTDAEKAALKEMRLQKTGGIIIKQGDGKLILVNAQKKFAPADIDRVIAQFRDKLRINVEVRPGSWQLGDKIPADANLAL